MVYTMRIEGVEGATANVLAATRYAQQQQLALAHEYGAIGVQQVRSRASGRPGPRIITGQYLSTITYRVVPGVGGATAEVYSDAPQAQRLELGFYGTDSLGRSYQQPPYEHFRPAGDYLFGHYVAAQNVLARQIVTIGNGGVGGGGRGRGGGLIGRILGGLFGR